MEVDSSYSRHRLTIPGVTCPPPPAALRHRRDGRLMPKHRSNKRDRICRIDAMAGNFKPEQRSIESTRQGPAMAKT